MSYDVQREISNLFREATELNRKIGRLEAHIKHGTALPAIELFDTHAFVERISLPTLENRDERAESPRSDLPSPLGM